MGVNRLFWPQETMDEWVVDEKAQIKDDVVTLTEGNKQYKIEQAVHFIQDVGDGDDPYALTGKVKELSTLEQMDAEHYMDSVIIKDSAYQVVTGFTGIPLQSDPPRKIENDDNSDDKDLLANFLLNNL
ncbi:MAG: hypothetical protein JXR91_10445 [Deltaproteobacteria bacterium]|nr:hypothetical protein [Deltaproteobacteria bacterium]